MAIFDPKTRLRRMKTLARPILEACTLSGENKERLMALSWHESLCSFALDPPGCPVGWGDNGNAFGPFQIDKRYHAEFIQRELGRYSWAIKQSLPYSPVQQALYACGLLREAREWFKRGPITLVGDLLERAVYASYNAGPASVASTVRHSTPNATAIVEAAIDKSTTGKNYSASIFALASILQKPEYQWIWN
jgi:hypothetical protein